MSKNIKEEASQLSRLAKEMFSGDFQIRPIGDTMTELAEKYNSAISVQDNLLAGQVVEAAAAASAAEAAAMKALVIGRFLRDAKPVAPGKK